MAERKTPARRSAKADTSGSTPKKAAPRKAAAKKADPEPTNETAVGPAVEPVGYIGSAPDPTPNEHYTLPGVIAGKPVPEHDK